MKISQLLEKMWFEPISQQEPLYLAPDRPDHMWLTIETVVPLPKLMFLDLKKEGFQPLYVSEVDLEKDEAILSLVMEV